MILRFSLLFLFASGVSCQVELDDVFIEQDINDIQSSDCEEIVGELSGCNHCYPCNHPTIQFYKGQNTDIRTLVLNTKKCVPTTVCCVNQVSYVSRLADTCSTTDCGVRNAEGVGARTARPGPRTVLNGEYPWAAYLFKKVNNKLEYLCSVTFINDKSLSFLTSAAYVKDVNVAQLAVRFDRYPSKQDTASNVKNVILHEDYVAEKSWNNIAIIVLSNAAKVPNWANVICLPNKEVPYGTPCTTLTDNNLFVNTVMPKRDTCELSDESQMCSVAPPFDYTPAHGNGLYCEVDCSGVNKYKLFGIASKASKGEVTVYADVYNLLEWISRNTPK